MPAGVPLGEYLRFFGAAMLSMMAGSQTVHLYYKPLKDLDVYIEQEMKTHTMPATAATKTPTHVNENAQ